MAEIIVTKCDKCDELTKCLKHVKGPFWNRKIQWLCFWCGLVEVFKIKKPSHD